MKEILKKTKRKIYLAMVMSSAFMITALPVSAANALEKSMDGAAMGFYEQYKGILRPIIVVIFLIIGGAFLWGSSRKKDEAKEGLPDRIIGLICIVCAPTAATILYGWF